jgi:hypothetical protein
MHDHDDPHFNTIGGCRCRCTLCWAWASQECICPDCAHRTVAVLPG